MEFRAAQIAGARRRNQTGRGCRWKKFPRAAAPSLADLSFGQLCKIGLAMTWPLLLVALGALGIFIAILARK